MVAISIDNTDLNLAHGAGTVTSKLGSKPAEEREKEV